jgi:hypothetical protein
MSLRPLRILCFLCDTKKQKARSDYPTGLCLLITPFTGDEFVCTTVVCRDINCPLQNQSELFAALLCTN